MPITSRSGFRVSLGTQAPGTPQLALLTGGPRGPPVKNYISEQSKADSARYPTACVVDGWSAQNTLELIKADSPKYSQLALLAGGPRGPPINNYVAERSKADSPRYPPHHITRGTLGTKRISRARPETVLLPATASGEAKLSWPRQRCFPPSPLIAKPLLQRLALLTMNLF